MKKTFVIIFVVFVVYAVMLITPVALFFFQLSSLEFEGQALYDQLSALSALTIVENPGETERTSKHHFLTITITDENFSSTLYDALIKQKNSFMRLHLVDTTISPERIHLAISSNYGILGIFPYKTAVFSEWMVRVLDADDVSFVEIKPVNIHTNHLYTVNFAKLWKYVSNTETSEGWLVLPSSSQFQIRDITLEDHELSLNVVL